MAALTAALSVVALAGAAVPSHAQTLYGSVTGTVSDPQGAALPGVTVTATNTGTSLKLEQVTDGTGNFTFRNLPPGSYDLTAGLEGFKELKQTGLTVTAGNPIRVDLKLELGGITETVNVNAEAAIIQTEKADLSTELTAKQVTTLPLNQYRNYQSLLNLVPGATPVQFQNAEIDTPGRALTTNVNGTQRNANTTRIDGAVSVNVWLPHHAGYIQPAETIETVNIETNNFGADVGMAAGAAQMVVTKSGTNEFRGSGFWFYNGEELNTNTYYNKQFDIEKTPLNRQTYGGTLGGPIVKNRLFFFGSYENFRDRRTNTARYTVPSTRMRAGDFSEVAAAYPDFRLYNPFTGNAAGSGRSQFGNFQIPGNLISPIAQRIMSLYPAAGGQDLDSNGLLDDFSRQEKVTVDRANYDIKLTLQRNAAHSVWGKFSLLDAEVVDNFILGWDAGSFGDTRVYVGSAGHTWTLTPTLVLDGNFGYYRMDQTVTGPDYGTNYGIEFGIPGTNDPNDIRASGMPAIDNGYYIGGTPSWMPLFRKEQNYTFSTALTKVFARHEVRTGVDVVKLTLDHRQAEFGDYGLRGGIRFDSSTTGDPNYISPGWNNFASFLMGLGGYYGKDVQTETMTGREWQTALYVNDRWRVNDQVTLNLGLRVENYPLMSRQNSGLERLDYATYNVLLGGRGSVPKDVGIEMKQWYLAPRLGATYRLNEDTVARAGYGITYNPLPWSRPMRGSFPYDTFFSNSAEQFLWNTTLASGIPAVPVPDYSSGVVQLPSGVFIRTPNPTDLDRARIQQWNIAVERRFPLDIAVEVAYVGTATDGGYADANVNYGEPGLGNAGLKYFAQAGTSGINEWAARTKSRYHGLQIAINRPFKNGLMLKGAYTFSKSKNMTDDDGWTSVTWNHPLMYDENYATAGFDRTHVFQLGFAYQLPFLREDTTALGAVLGGWQLNGTFGAYSGTPFSIDGSNNQLNCVNCGSVLINVSGDPSPSGSPGSGTEAWYDKSVFSQPTGTDKSGFGTSKRNQFRRPAQWNLDMSMFKTFRFGRVEPEVRIQFDNIFDNENWGAPNTSFTSNQFMFFTPDAEIANPRRITLGLRVGF
jgi:hypothetical protein